VRDVAIVGAGPAGLTTARLLAASGHDVVVFEEHGEVGVPVHCTGVLGMDAFSEFPLPTESILGTAHVATFVAADGSSVSVDAERVQAAVIDRAQFDRVLADASRAAGADVRRGARVRTIEIGDDSAGIVLDSGARVHARSVVLACGANYRFNRQLGLGVPRSFVQSAQLERPFSGPASVEVHLGREIAPAGFAWAVPFQRDGQPYTRIGLMCVSRALAHFRRFAARLRDRFE